MTLAGRTQTGHPPPPANTGIQLLEAVTTTSIGCRLSLILPCFSDTAPTSSASWLFLANLPVWQKTKLCSLSIRLWTINACSPFGVFLLVSSTNFSVLVQVLRLNFCPAHLAAHQYQHTIDEGGGWMPNPIDEGGGWMPNPIDEGGGA